MHDITPEAVRIAQEGKLHFIEAVQAARRDSRAAKPAAPLVLTLDAFYDDPLLLYACLWYAYSQEVTVTFHPKERKAGSKAALHDGRTISDR